MVKLKKAKSGVSNHGNLQKQVNAPQSYKKSRQFDQILRTEAKWPSCMNLTMINGFSTALYMTPTLVSRNTAAMMMLGRPPYSALIYVDQVLVPNIIAHMDFVKERLDDRKRTYRIHFSRDIQSNKLALLKIRNWARGFVAGMHFDDLYWSDLCESLRVIPDLVKRLTNVRTAEDLNAATYQDIEPRQVVELLSGIVQMDYWRHRYQDTWVDMVFPDFEELTRGQEAQQKCVDPTLSSEGIQDVMQEAIVSAPPMTT